MIVYRHHWLGFQVINYISLAQAALTFVLLIIIGTFSRSAALRRVEIVRTVALVIWYKLISIRSDWGYWIICPWTRSICQYDCIRTYFYAMYVDAWYILKHPFQLIHGNYTFPGLEWLDLGHFSALNKPSCRTLLTLQMRMRF